MLLNVPIRHVLLLLLPLSVLDGWCDSIPPVHRDYQYVKHADPWLTSANGAALTRYKSDDLVEAQVSLHKGDGGFVNFYDSDNTLSVHAGIESFQRLNQHVVVFGGMSYDNWNGSDLTGSAFMHTGSFFGGHYPFDIVEDSLTNAGDKHRDTYHLYAGVGADIYSGISIGAHVSYTSANSAKYKDLRYKNKLMDLSLSASAYIPVCRWMNLGGTYRYHRNTESLTFGTYGKSEKVYKSLIDYGVMMGRVEQFGSDGYTDKSREMPLFEDGHGVQGELEFLPLSHLSCFWRTLSIYGLFSYDHGSGYYGRKSPYTITYTRHDRDVINASGKFSVRPGSSLFTLGITYRHESLHNDAETFRELTNDNGAFYYEYFDPVETGDKHWQDFSLTAGAMLGISGELPTWSLSAGYHWRERKQSSYLYPYYRHQLLSRDALSVDVTRNIPVRRGVWSVMLRGMFSEGSGKAYADGTFIAPSEGEDPPAMMDALLWREYRYLTAPNYLLGGSVKYAFPIPGTKMAGHALISGTYQKANGTNVYCQGDHHTEFSVAIGVKF